MVSTRDCESLSMGSTPIHRPKLEIVYKAQGLSDVGKITQLSFSSKHIINNDATHAKIT